MSATHSHSAALTPWIQARGEVTRNDDQGAGHRWLDIALPSEFVAPAPGQFVQLLLDESTNPAFLPRPMSVAGVKRRGRGIEVGFLYAPVGVGTRALATLEPGAPIECLGPLGRGYPLELPGTQVLIAGGRGVAPLLFAADALKRRAIEFIFGARDAEHLVGLGDATARLKRTGGHLHLCTDDGSRGTRGNVVQVLDRIAPGLEGPLVLHACGPHGMLKAIALWALEHEVPAFLAMESVMACGTGVCRGCPLPRSAESTEAFQNTAPSLLGNREYAMCCTEGPVFEAGELDWSRIH
jgi:dihydroorotate dehydrogenase electron transfer subunit